MRMHTLRFVVGLLLVLGLWRCYFQRDLAELVPARGGNSPEYALRQSIVDFAREHIGARYRYGGRDPRNGFDCSGFTHYVLDRHDINLTPQSGAQAEQGRRISPRDAQPGDLVFFQRSAAGPVFHVALVVANAPDGLVVVHSTTSKGVIETNISQSSYWGPKLRSARDVITH